jgi:hypothetical protein
LAARHIELIALPDFRKLLASPLRISGISARRRLRLNFASSPAAYRMAIIT